MVSERVMARDEIVETLAALRLSKAWLATQIKESRQSVSNWLDIQNPTDPQDPTVWERMTSALMTMGKPKEVIPDDLREMGIEIALAVLSGDEDTARRLAPGLIRELSRPYGKHSGKKSL
jgi:hypothetical protein